MEILRTVPVLVKNEIYTKTTYATSSNIYPTVTNELNTNVHIFPFSFHFKGPNSLSRIKLDKNSKSPSTKTAWNSERQEAPSGHLLDKQAQSQPRRLPRTLLGTVPTGPCSGGRQRQVPGSTYPQYLLWTLAQQADFQIAFPPVVTSYLAVAHQGREGVLWSCKIMQL